MRRAVMILGLGAAGAAGGCGAATPTTASAPPPVVVLPTPPPAPQRELYLTPPGDTTVYAGRTVKVVVGLQRRNVSGPVTLTFDHLPAGVSVIAAQQNLAVEG